MVVTNNTIETKNLTKPNMGARLNPLGPPGLKEVTTNITKKVYALNRRNREAPITDVTRRALVLQIVDVRAIKGTARLKAYTGIWIKRKNSHA
jgi:hypothetical protein